MANPKGYPKNLKPWKKGEAPNPAGRPPNPPELKAIKAMTKGELELLVHKILQASPGDLKEFKNTVLELWLAQGASKAIQSGDYSRLMLLIERLYGKVPTNIANADEQGFKIIVEDYTKNNE